MSRVKFPGVGRKLVEECDDKNDNEETIETPPLIQTHVITNRFIDETEEQEEETRLANIEHQVSIPIYQEDRVVNLQPLHTQRVMQLCAFIDSVESLIGAITGRSDNSTQRISSIISGNGNYDYTVNAQYAIPKHLIEHFLPCEAFKCKKKHSCSLCLDEIENGDYVRIFPCGHSVHLDCKIDEWLSKNGTCPMCRSKVLCQRQLDYLKILLSGNYKKFEKKTQLLIKSMPIMFNGKVYIF